MAPGDRDAHDGETGAPDGELPAGGFAAWVDEMEAALRGERPATVPCGDCTACCTSSQFVHIGPDEAATLAHIPEALLFPAPRLPRGHVLLGYDERGHCPMLGEHGCTIYAHRPRACRTYDCRVFPAAGLAPGEGKQAIAARARRWRFTVDSAEDRARLGAVRAAASHLAAHPDLAPPGSGPPEGTALAVLAIEAHGAFLRRAGAVPEVVPAPDPAAVRVALRTGRAARRPA